MFGYVKEVSMKGHEYLYALLTLGSKGWKGRGWGNRRSQNLGIAKKGGR